MIDKLKPSLGFGSANAFALYSMYKRRQRRNAYGSSGSGLRRKTSNRNAGSRTLTKTRKRNTSGLGVTGQYDRKLVYLKKSMPRFKKSRWRKFTNQVHAVAEKELGNNTVLFNTAITATNVVDGKQVVQTLSLYSQNGTTANQDLYYLSNLGNYGNPTLTDGISLSASTKYIFQSAILDVTLQNASQYTDGSGLITNPSQARMECDVYECYVRKEANFGSTAVNSFEALLQYNASSYDRLIKDGNTAPSANQVLPDSRGATPWECATSLGIFGVKIMKKTKFMLSQGETVTYQVRDPKRHTVEESKIFKMIGFNHPRLTKVIFIVAKLTPQCTPIGITPNSYQEILKIGASRKYFYKYEGQNEDRTLYVSNR